MLQEIIERIWEEDELAAANLLVGILNVVGLLASHPYLGAAYRPGKTRNLVREVQHHNYRIFYRVERSTKRVLVLCVWHAARQEPDFL